MAGLFDFKSAEDILKERQDATRKNVMQAFNQPGQYAVRGERGANAIGKALGLLGGKLFADSPEEQVAGQMQRANQLTQSLKPVEGESQSQFYNRVAVSFNDAGYSQNALRALTLAKEAEAVDAKEAQRQKERGEMTPYQQAQIQVAEDKNAIERSIYGVGTGATAPTATGNPPPNKLPDGTKLNVDGVLNVIVDGKPVPEEQVNAALELSKKGVGTEPSAGEGLLETLASPFRNLNIWNQGVENKSSITFVRNAIERNSFRPEDIRAAESVAKMPREETGFTEEEYKIIERVAAGGLKLGGK